MRLHDTTFMLGLGCWVCHPALCLHCPAFACTALHRPPMACAGAVFVVRLDARWAFWWLRRALLPHLVALGVRARDKGRAGAEGHGLRVRRGHSAWDAYEAREAVHPLRCPYTGVLGPCVVRFAICGFFWKAGGLLCVLREGGRFVSCGRAHVAGFSKYFFHAPSPQWGR
jgi:hypothetical protein